MDLIFILIVILISIIEARDQAISKTIDVIPKRRFDIEDIDSQLPEAEPMLPGHTLLRPSKTMLKSAAKFPSDDTSAVYGNYGNLGITYDKTNDRVMYTGFRKGNYLLANIVNAIKNITKKIRDKKKKAIKRRLNLEEIDGLQELPEAEPMLPGHTLLRPSKTMLKSAVKFPSDDKNAVYGNYDNLGITYDNTNERVMYTSFRKGNDMLANIINAINKITENNENKMKQAIIIVNSRTETPKNVSKAKQIEYLLNNGGIVPEEENNANEILDESEESEEEIGLGFRRKRTEKFRDRSALYNTSSGTDTPTSSSGSSDFERNPGNPFTIFKNKYRQNWMWNHFMDGDHMNINPYGPALHNLGPSGPQLFFNRKWWYFNQDDYKPMG